MAKKPKNLTPREARLLEVLLSKPLTPAQAASLLGPNPEDVLASLASRGYIRVTAAQVSLTPAGRAALAPRTPGPRFYAELTDTGLKPVPNNPRELIRLRRQGKRIVECRHLAATPKKRRKTNIHEKLEKAYKALSAGQPRYASIQLYAIAKSLGKQDLAHKALKLAQNPQPAQIAKLLETIQKLCLSL